MTRLLVEPVEGIGELSHGDDLAAEIAGRADLCDGDIVVVTSKVVSKVEGRVVLDRPKDDVLAEETDRVVARRGTTSIVRTHHGLVMAAAGIDASNVRAGALVLLPRDPDGSARQLRDDLRERFGVDVAVVVSDTSGRAWRNGQTDIAVGAAGLLPVVDHAGLQDSYGNELVVTAPALADEVAAAADLVKQKLAGRPVAVVRGLGHLLLPPGEHGPGARALVREETGDMFGLGAREAVLAALGQEPDLRGFGAPAPAEDLLGALRQLLPGSASAQPGHDKITVTADPSDPAEAATAHTTARAVCHAHAWTCTAAADGLSVCRPATTPHP